uniref:Uncharacterized protein n=1 Tax=Aegilops tauschii subsp. strangulata TaxID=200361 RepID=A0A453C4D1_AEGTS
MTIDLPSDACTCLCGQQPFSYVRNMQVTYMFCCQQRELLMSVIVSGWVHMNLFYNSHIPMLTKLLPCY